MGSSLDQGALIQNQYLVGVPDGVEPVGDHDDAAPRSQLAERGLDGVLGAWVYRGGYFIQQEQRRILEQCPGDRQPLPLSSRRPNPDSPTFVW